MNIKPFTHDGYVTAYSWPTTMRRVNMAFKRHGYITPTALRWLVTRMEADKRQALPRGQRRKAA